MRITERYQRLFEDDERIGAQAEDIVSIIDDLADQPEVSDRLNNLLALVNKKLKKSMMHKFLDDADVKAFSESVQEQVINKIQTEEPDVKDALLILLLVNAFKLKVSNVKADKEEAQQEGEEEPKE